MESSSLPGAHIHLDRASRDVKNVPFVELAGNRLHGVVSSGSDIERVYVSYFEAGSLDYCCSTNNNRPCGGLRGSPCKHLREMLHEAIIQYGLETVVRFLRITDQIFTERDIYSHVGQYKAEYGGEIFSRFLADLELMEVPGTNMPLTAMAWFQE